MNVLYEEIEGTPFGIMVIADVDIVGGFHWFLLHGDDDSDNEFLLEDDQVYMSVTEAFDAALQKTSAKFSQWLVALANKRRELNYRQVQ